MPLLGQAAMLLSFDVAQEAIAEHEDWHTHEHLEERVSIPGFLRATRWIAVRGEPRYLIVYEVSGLAVLTSEAYLSRLNNPTQWTSKVMPTYRGMRRAFCAVTGSFGLGTGHLCALLRFKPQPEAEAAMRDWLLREALPRLPARRGIGSVHLLEEGAPPPMTNEQRIRGADGRIGWALLLTGYDEEALTQLTQTELGIPHLRQHRAGDVHDALYRMDYMLSREELAAQAP